MALELPDSTVLVRKLDEYLNERRNDRTFWLLLVDKRKVNIERSLRRVEGQPIQFIALQSPGKS